MPEILDLPVVLATAAFDPKGKTVAEVVDHVSRVLRRTDNEPEWVTHANFIDADCPDRFGLAPSALWPVERLNRRLGLSVERANSEGWIILVDSIELIHNDEAEFWKAVPLLRIKSLSRSQAWAVAAVVSRLLDVD